MDKDLVGTGSTPEIDSAAAEGPRAGGKIAFHKVAIGGKEEQEHEHLTAAVEALARVLAAVLRRGGQS